MSDLLLLPLRIVWWLFVLALKLVVILLGLAVSALLIAIWIFVELFISK